MFYSIIGLSLGFFAKLMSIRFLAKLMSIQQRVFRDATLLSLGDLTSAPKTEINITDQ